MCSRADRVCVCVNPHTHRAAAPLISMGLYEDEDCHYYWIKQISTHLHGRTLEAVSAGEGVFTSEPSWKEQRWKEARPLDFLLLPPPPSAPSLGPSSDSPSRHRKWPPVNRKQWGQWMWQWWGGLQVQSTSSTHTELINTQNSMRCFYLFFMSGAV